MQDPTRNLTLSHFREMTKDLPGDTPLCYFAYDHGCCLGVFSERNFLLCETQGKSERKKVIVLNPGSGYDGRLVKGIAKKENGLRKEHEL